MSSKVVNSPSALSVLLACQSVMREYDLKSVHRVLVLLVLGECERVHGYCSGMMLQRAVNRQSANVIIWLEQAGYIERTGKALKPRRLSPAGWRVVSSFASQCAEYERRGLVDVLPQGGRNGRTREKAARRAQYLKDMDTRTTSAIAF